MTLITTLTEIEYPESDGRPMGETDLHRRWMIRIFDLLSYRYRHQPVYVASDLLVYYEKDEPIRYVVPDDFLVFDLEPGDRRVFKTWEEGKTPDVVFEVTSRSTRTEDLTRKPKVYQEIGVQEYFLYDPTEDYLSPPLQGFRLQEGIYDQIEPDASGALVSEQLDVLLRREDRDLVMQDRTTGQVLQTEAEAGWSAADAERKRAEAERRRADEAEEELRRLRAQLKSADGERGLS